MYRNKIMIIAAVFVTVLLGVMIWSAHVVADNHAQQKPRTEQEQAEQKMAEDEFAKEHDMNPGESENPQQGETSGASGELLPQADQYKPLEIDESVIVPELTERIAYNNRVERNYLDKLVGMKRLVLWNPSTFPLKVFIKDQANLPAGFADGIQTAFNNWQNTSKLFVMFVFVSDEGLADIVVEVPDGAPANCDAEEGIEVRFDIAGVKLQKAHLIVSKDDCNGNPRNVAQLYASVQHHVGHILGIDGHSDRVADVMYSKNSYENINISDIDINTLKYLYNFVPDVTNKPLEQEELRKRFRISSIKNKSASDIDNFLKDNLVSKNNQNSPFEKALNTGMKYLDQGNYKMAVTYFNTALDKATDKFDRAYVCRIAAIAFLRSDKDTDKALEYANEAYRIANSPTNDYLLAYIEYTMQQDSDALKRLERLMHDYPRLRPAYSLAAKIYEKKDDKEKLRDLSQKARDNFFENPPVVFNE